MIDTSQAFGRFRIDREIGRGGQSVVYLAQDTRLDREVAFALINFPVTHLTQTRALGSPR